MTYNEALTHLEEISEEIHRLREQTKKQMEEYNQTEGVDVTCAITAEQETTTNLSNSSSQIESTDEYLEFPLKLSLKSSPIKQKHLDKHSCPHLLRDFNFGASCSRLGCERNTDDSDGTFSPNQTDIVSSYMYKKKCLSPSISETTNFFFRPIYRQTILNIGLKYDCQIQIVRVQSTRHQSMIFRAVKKVPKIPITMLAERL